jgi:hypothetical protein
MRVGLEEEQIFCTDKGLQLDTLDDEMEDDEDVEDTEDDEEDDDEQGQ